jgi:hypothetical protein
MPARKSGQSGDFGQRPAPARFALHKLMISQRRTAHLQTKKLKDTSQAEQLLRVLITDRPGDLLLAWESGQRTTRKIHGTATQWLGIIITSTA